MAAQSKSAKLDRKKLFSDPVMVGMISILLIFLVLFIVYPLFVLLIDSIYTEGKLTLSVFQRVLSMKRFRTAFSNTLVLGLLTGILSTAIGLLFAYVDVYVKIKNKAVGKLFNVVSLLPVVSPPFVLSLSTIMLFGRSGIITRSLHHIYDSNVYMREYTYLGIVGDKNSEGMYAIEQRNKFSVGEELEVMKPDGRNLVVKVCRIKDAEGNVRESAPHPKELLYIDLGTALNKYDILRRREE